MFKQKALAVAISCILLGACGGGGSSTTSSTTSDDTTTESSDSTTTNSDGEVLSSVTTGIDLPSELSAVPTDSDSSAALKRSLLRKLKGMSRAVSDLAATSDYHTTLSKKFVEERALEQFDIIEQVLGALGQTKYADEDNINAGAYTAMIAWIDDGEGGREIKTLQPWVIDSRMIVEAHPVSGEDVDVNRVLAWIEEVDDGETEYIKAEFKIYQSATQDDEGNYTDYGEWVMNVSFDDTGEDFFAANSFIDADSNNTIMVHESGAGPFDGETRGVLVRNLASGHGKVQYPDWESCWQQFDDAAEGDGEDEESEGEGEGQSEESGDEFECNPESITATYAYNANYLAVQEDGDSDPVYKDRDPDNATEITHRYGLFYAAADANAGIEAGEDVERSKSFGFPINYTPDGEDYNIHAYYGAWQGRHQLWGPDQLSAGDTVSRGDLGPDDDPVTYTVSATFNGTLTKRTVTEGNLNDILDLTVETWTNEGYQFFYDGDEEAWTYCEGYVDWGQNPPVCRDHSDDSDLGFEEYDNFDALVVGENSRKWVNIGRWDEDNQQPVNYVYYNEDPQVTSFTFDGAGFYEATWGNNGMVPTTPAAKLTPADGMNLWVDIGGSIYISYTGDFSGSNTGWVEKTLLDFDTRTWQPTFDEDGDLTFSPEVGQEYYINNRGTNYIVKRRAESDAASSYDVLLELQSAANPVNITSMLPTGTSYLATPWESETQYTFGTDSSDSTTFMKLVYLTDDPNTDDVDESTTTTVQTSGIWGLQAFNSDDEPLLANGTAVTVDEHGFPTDENVRILEFNWEYSSDGGWGTQQYLMSDSSTYVILDDPISLASMSLTNGAGENKTVSIQFDGWMHGLPDPYWLLQQNSWVMTEEIQDKIISIAAGTEATDANDSNTTYYIKPLETSVFLDIVPSSTSGLPSLTDAAAVDLDDVPDFVDHEMGDMPTDTEVKYSEGIPVDEDDE